MQGAHDHIERLERQVHTLKASLASSGPAESQATKALNSELARMRAELADARGSVAQLQRKLQEEHAEVLMLKESHGGSNKAGDVIQALESQVSTLCMTFFVCCCLLFGVAACIYAVLDVGSLGRYDNPKTFVPSCVLKSLSCV